MKLLMSIKSLNNIFIYGIEKFAKNINDAGVDAVICVDLPTDVKEEKELNSALKKYEIALIKLITPTTDDKRIEETKSKQRIKIYKKYCKEFMKKKFKKRNKQFDNFETIQMTKVKKNQPV